MKVPQGKAVYHKGKKYKAGNELPADYKFSEKDEKKFSEKKLEIKPAHEGKKDGFTSGS